jgi:hypothetical protein
MLRARREERYAVSELPRARNGVGEPTHSLVTLTHVIYGLHALSLITGIIGAATVVGAFLTGWPSNHRGDPELREAQRGSRDVAGVVFDDGPAQAAGYGAYLDQMEDVR